MPGWLIALCSILGTLLVVLGVVYYQAWKSWGNS